MTDILHDLPQPTLDEHLCLGIYLAHLEVQRTYKPHLDAMGLTYPQYLVMNLLWEADGQAVGELAKKLDLEPSTLTPLLKRLETSGFVSRRRSKEDERQVSIFATAEGMALQSQVDCLTIAMLKGSDMEVDEILALNERMRILAKSLRDNRLKPSAG